MGVVNFRWERPVICHICMGVVAPMSRAPSARAVGVPCVLFRFHFLFLKPIIQVRRASAWLVALRVLPKQRCGIGWTGRPARSPQRPAWEPAFRPGPAPRFGWLLSTEVERRRRGGGALTSLYLSFLWESSFLFLVFSILFPLGRPPLSGVVGWSPGAFSNGPFAPGNELSIKLYSVNLVQNFTRK